MLASDQVRYSSASDYGSAGLIDMPSSRMQPDATFSTSYSRQDVSDVYSLTYQAAPWLEASFRYTIFDPRVDRDDSADGLRDRSYELKARVIKESKYLPEVSVGVRDLIGTGVFGAEYVVGSKKIGDFDFTLGMGWGRLSGESVASNPLKSIDSRFGERTAETGLGGEARFSDLFRGQDVGLFGGVEYRPNSGRLSIIAEYNSDTYDRESSSGIVDVESPISVGVNWEVSNGLVLGASWQHGSEVGLRLSSHLNTKKIQPRHWQTFPWHRYKRRTGVLDENDQSWFEKMETDSELAGYKLVSGSIQNRSHALIEYQNIAYTLNSDAAERVMASAGVHLPDEVERVTLVLNQSGMYPLRITYLRKALDDRDAQRKDPGRALRQVDYLPGRSIKNPQWRSATNKPKLNLDVGISPRVSLFDPDVPFAYQVFAGLKASLSMPSGWGLSGQYRYDLDNNFGGIDRPSDSVLPRVKTDADRYMKEGTTGVSHLYLQKRGEIAQDIYYHGFAGVLETQYSGVGAEVLYFPFRSRVAVGVNLISVRQREFDGGFGLRDYKTTIGHVSAYWATPFYNYDVAVHTGRYLAGDRGATVELNRTFANGWSVGVFATKTNVSAEEFGEGSFDKGFRILIPFNALFGGNTRAKNNLLIRPIQRDGGARLDGFGSTLWETLRPARYDVITETEHRLLHP